MRLYRTVSIWGARTACAYRYVIAGRGCKPWWCPCCPCCWPWRRHEKSNRTRKTKEDILPQGYKVRWLAVSRVGVAQQGLESVFLHDRVVLRYRTVTLGRRAVQETFSCLALHRPSHTLFHLCSTLSKSTHLYPLAATSTLPSPTCIDPVAPLP